MSSVRGPTVPPTMREYLRATGYALLWTMALAFLMILLLQKCDPRRSAQSAPITDIAATVAVVPTSVAVVPTSVEPLAREQLAKGFYRYRVDRDGVVCYLHLPTGLMLGAVGLSCLAIPR